jgi:hypothetical protein
VLNRLVTALVCFLFITILSSSFSVVKAVNEITILQPPPNTKPYGLTYEEHVENFYKWLLSMPTNENPVNDPTGQKCANGQTNTNSSVFYLVGIGGGTSHKTCKVPAGKSVFIPVGTVEASDKEAPNASVDELNKIAKKDQDSITSLSLKIGDKQYSFDDLKKYRVHTGVFDVVFPKKALFGVSEGKSKVVADGYHIITQKLPKGTYMINYKDSLICPGGDCSAPNFAEDASFTLIVQ